MGRHLCLLFLLVVTLALCGCQPVPVDGKNPSIPPTTDTSLTFLSFSENGSYFKRVQGYEFRAEDGKSTAYFSMANEEEPYAVHVDQAWVDTLSSFIGQYGMMTWDGFQGSDSMLLDGMHFSIDFTFADGTAVHASGYGKFPSGYRQASDAIDAHFMQLLPEDMRDW